MNYREVLQAIKERKDFPNIKNDFFIIYSLAEDLILNDFEGKRNLQILLSYFRNGKREVETEEEKEVVNEYEKIMDDQADEKKTPDNLKKEKYVLHGTEVVNDLCISSFGRIRILQDTTDYILRKYHQGSTSLCLYIEDDVLYLKDNDPLSVLEVHLCRKTFKNILVESKKDFYGSFSLVGKLKVKSNLKIGYIGNCLQLDLTSFGNVDYGGKSPVVKMNSVYGNLSFQGESENLSMKTYSGNIDIYGCIKTKDVKTYSGNVRTI